MHCNIKGFGLKLNGRRRAAEIRSHYSQVMVWSLPMLHSCTLPVRVLTRKACEPVAEIW